MRKIPQLHDCTVVLVLESNLAFEAQHLMHALNANNVRRWVALSEGQGGTVGWLTTNERKEAMCFQLRDALRVGCIGLSTHFFTLTMEKREMLKLLDDEMRNFCILVEAPKTPFGKIKKVIRFCYHRTQTPDTRCLCYRHTQEKWEAETTTW